jgi:hypothetical protein
VLITEAPYVGRTELSWKIFQIRHKRKNAEEESREILDKREREREGA